MRASVEKRVAGAICDRLPVLPDRLACFRAVTTTIGDHMADVTGGKHPYDLPQFRWINTLVG